MLRRLEDGPFITGRTKTGEPVIHPSLFLQSPACYLAEGFFARDMTLCTVFNMIRQLSHPGGSWSVLLKRTGNPLGLILEGPYSGLLGQFVGDLFRPARYIKRKLNHNQYKVVQDLDHLTGDQQKTFYSALESNFWIEALSNSGLVDLAAVPLINIISDKDKLR